MSSITVRNTPNLTTTHQQSLFEETWTYIDYQGVYKHRNSLVSTLGAALESRLEAIRDDSLDPYISRDTCTYWTLKPPHVVFNVLDGLGYRVVAAITINQTAVWTLQRQ